MQLRRSFSFILLPAVYVFAEQVGDFAPLEIGATWIYESVSESRVMSDKQYDSSWIYMHVIGSARPGDTTRYFFHNVRRNTCIEELYIHGNCDTTITELSQDDTLLEIDGSITPCKSWVNFIVPVCSRHTFATESGDDEYAVVDTNVTTV